MARQSVMSKKCPKCGSEDYWYLGKKIGDSSIDIWKCDDCQEEFEDEVKSERIE